MQSFQSPFGRAGTLLGRVVRCAAFISSLVVPGRALATPEYPVAVDITIGTECPYPNSRCLMCHTTARGGQGTAAQPFAIELRKYGLNRGHDPGLLQSALMALPEDQDSDRDGEPDKEELRFCGNPSGEDLGIGPEYGCDGARLAPRSASEVGPLSGAAAVVFAALALSRRRTSTRRTP